MTISVLLCKLLAVALDFKLFMCASLALSDGDGCCPCAELRDLVRSRLIGPLRWRNCPSSQVIQVVPMAELLVKVREIRWNLGLAKPFEVID